MKRSIDIIKQPRILVLKEIEHLSTEQLNKVPTSFNNNIAWNLGHMIAAQQGICYKRSGLNTTVSEDFFHTYKPGTKPERFIDEVEIAFIKEQLFISLEKLEADLDKEIFVDYTKVMTRYGIELSSIEEAVAFLPFHEGLHIGYIMSLRKLV
ncbi:DinB superfamily protein [Mucilaginibacter mallensis]|uniref:DinB superfamily protein n=1 Tax=Mucilaginibacter mallensis TaxID=652787 RepID=A0A1H2AS18_MUCMA|nr:DinB family protein [Mucilaginibacter mallensis]SDT48577.1 DinB superfamily protein [Mucilaginibacter mallensis]